MHLIAADLLSIKDIESAAAVSVDVSRFGETDALFSHMLTITGADDAIQHAGTLLADMLDAAFDV